MAPEVAAIGEALGRFRAIVRDAVTKTEPRLACEEIESYLAGLSSLPPAIFCDLADYMPIWDQFVDLVLSSILSFEARMRLLLLGLGRSAEAQWFFSTICDPVALFLLVLESEVPEGVICDLSAYQAAKQLASEAPADRPLTGTAVSTHIGLQDQGGVLVHLDEMEQSLRLWIACTDWSVPF